jgi:hypothetical protein
MRWDPQHDGDGGSGIFARLRLSQSSIGGGRGEKRATRVWRG